MQFLLAHLTKCLCTRRFSEPTFRASGATKHWKNTVFRDFYLFARFPLLSSDSFSSLLFFLPPFSPLILPTSAASSVHIVGSLTSKLIYRFPSHRCRCGDGARLWSRQVASKCSGHAARSAAVRASGAPRKAEAPGRDCDSRTRSTLGIWVCL